MAPAEAGRPEPGIDVHALFCHYNSLYFHESLGACAVSWTAARLPSGPSTCHCYPGGGCEILLSKPMLQCLSATDMKNVLLHEMIHAYMCINHDNTNHSDHGRSFQLMMNSINTSTVADRQRPVGGYKITAHHSPPNEVHNYKCETCGDFSQYGDCVGKVDSEAFCDNVSCHWHRHKDLCSGVFVKIQEPSGSKDKTILKADKALHEDKPTESLHITKKPTKNSGKGGGTDNKHEIKKDSLANSARSAGDAAGTSSNYSRENSGKKVVEPEAIDTKAPRLRIAEEIPKCARKNNRSSRLKRRKLSRRENGYTVIIGWLEVYGDEETDEDVEPLINKRAERRKQQRMLKNLQAAKDDSNSDIASRRKEDAYAGSNVSSPGKNHKSRPNSPPCSKEWPGSTTEISSVGTAANADTFSAPRMADDQRIRMDVYEPEGSSEDSPSNSPIRADIVDISDG